MSFSSDLKRFKKTAGGKSEMVFRAKVLGVMNNIIRRTPVDTGRARANWQASINSPIRATTDSTTRSGAEVAVVEKANTGDAIYFTNNLPYILELEKGSSTQAPLGMVRLSVLEAGGK